MKKNLARIFLSRSTSSLYAGCQFLLLYGVLPPQTSAHFILALMCVGFIPLADLTLSVNSTAFRQHAGSNPSFVTGLILALCGLTIFSATIVLAITTLVIRSDPHSALSTTFFYTMSLVVTINMAIPLFHECGQAYTKALKFMAFADLTALVLGILVALYYPEQALVVAVVTRLLFSLLSLLRVGGKASLKQLPAAMRWWGNQIKSRPRFIAIQVISVAAGAALFSFPAVFLMSSAGHHNFVQFALAISLTNTIVSLLSSFFSARTDVLIQATSGSILHERLQQARHTLRRVFVFYAPLSIAAMIFLLLLNKWIAEYMNIKVFSAFSPEVTAIALFAGFFNLCSQVVAMGQRIRGFDSFALPAFMFGVINITAIYHFGTSAFSVALIAACISIAGFASGAVFFRRAA